jgi:hypothetical protein
MLCPNGPVCVRQRLVLGGTDGHGLGEGCGYVR